MEHIQSLKFRDLHEFLDHLPKHESLIVQYLRSLILDCFPDPIEKISYNVPYYYQNYRVCFIWPASIPWGKTKKNGVLLGFCQGHLMRDEINFLDKGDRKQVFTKTFHMPKEIDKDLVRTYIFEALRVDKQLKLNSKKW